MTNEQILEIIERYKLRIPPTVYYDLKADIVNCSEIPTSSTTKNDLAVDAVSREDVHDMLENLPITVEDKWFNWLQKACMRLAELPSVTPQEPQTYKWCKGCKEYDQEKHCCPRWSKVIRNTVEEIKQEQEPRKGYLSIDDVMSVFDDFMCGEVDEDGTETFLEMLKDKAETEEV